MEKLQFNPTLDLSMVLFTVIAFLLHFQVWAKKGIADSNVDLMSRLPAARLRVVVLFFIIVLSCWALNFSVWAIYTVFLIVGWFIGFVGGGDSGNPGLLFFFIAYAIREWAFDFPELILTPGKFDAAVTRRKDEPCEQLGTLGVVVSPLRPSGEVELNGIAVSVVSEDGSYVDTGTNVVVTGTRNGRLLVAPSKTTEE
jgi:hypothetical protein